MVTADVVLAALQDLDVQSVDLNSQIHTAQMQAGARSKPRRFEDYTRAAVEAARQHAAAGLGVPGGGGFRRAGARKRWLALWGSSGRYPAKFYFPGPLGFARWNGVVLDTVAGWLRMPRSIRVHQSAAILHVDAHRRRTHCMLTNLIALRGQRHV